MEKDLLLGERKIGRDDLIVNLGNELSCKELEILQLRADLSEILKS